MSTELGTRFSVIRKQVTEKIGDIKRGHTIQKETEVKRIISDSSSISAEDIEAYREKLCNATFMSMSMIFPSNLGSILISPHLLELEIQNEICKIDNLTPEQLKQKMIEDAQRKAKAWGIKPSD